MTKEHYIYKVCNVDVSEFHVVVKTNTKCNGFVGSRNTMSTIYKNNYCDAYAICIEAFGISRGFVFNNLSEFLRHISCSKRFVLLEKNSKR